ncbi:MAG: lysophospholipid acyltransferase family protein [Xanthobacteraceae bacterium]
MLRLVLAGAGIVTAIAILLPFQLVAVRYSLRMQRRIPTVFHRLICALLGVRIKTVGSPSSQRPLLIVSNHVSWIDIAVITTLAPVAFVAKREVASWPLFGLFAKLQRSVFVDRTRRHKTPEVNTEIARRLADGDPVVLFGEGTSSDGNRVLPFRSALIGAARDALAAAGHVEHILIQPLSIAYVGFHGLPMGRQHRPLAAWYGDLDLFPHLRAVVGHGALDAVVSWGEPIAFDAGSDRKAFARTLETEVRRLTTAALRGREGKRAGAAEPQP